MKDLDSRLRGNDGMRPEKHFFNSHTVPNFPTSLYLKDLQILAKIDSGCKTNKGRGI